MKKYLPQAIFSFFLLSTPVSAHEFWLGPLDYTLDIGQEMQVEIRIGQDFKGNEYSYNPNQFHDYSITDSTGRHPLEGRIGDQPSVTMTPPNDGLVVLNHFSTSMMLTYADDGKFEAFLESAGLDWVLARHLDRGLPMFDFKEGYTRFAKALVAVGDGAGHDIITGMPLELVAQVNPYTDDLRRGFPVQLLWNGAGLPNIKVKVFHRQLDGTTVTNAYVRTDSNGVALIPIDGAGDYMINGVHMIIPTDEDIARTGAVWHSLWASMTFSVEN